MPELPVDCSQSACLPPALGEEFAKHSPDRHRTMNELIRTTWIVELLTNIDAEDYPRNNKEEGSHLLIKNNCTGSSNLNRHGRDAAAFWWDAIWMRVKVQFEMRLCFRDDFCFDDGSWWQLQDVRYKAMHWWCDHSDKMVKNQLNYALGIPQTLEFKTAMSTHAISRVL